MKYLTAEDLFSLLYELKEAFDLTKVRVNLGTKDQPLSDIDFRLSSINSNPSLNLYFYAGESEN